MFELIFTISICLTIAQFLIGLGGVIYNSVQFADWNRNLHTSIENEKKRANGEYVDSYRDYSQISCNEHKQEYATWTRQFGLAAVSSPLAIVLWPAALLGGAGWGVKIGVGQALPALTYKGDS